MGILDDAKYMLMAIDTAIEGIAKTPENYGSQVGAVLISSKGKIICSGYNHLVGSDRLHAEEVVINSVGQQDLLGSTLYVTLEPCQDYAHHSRKDCCALIPETGISRVVVGTRGRLSHTGIEYMRGIGLIVDVLHNEKIDRLCNLLISPEPGKAYSEKTLKRITETRALVNI